LCLFLELKMSRFCGLIAAIFRVFRSKGIVKKRGKNRHKGRSIDPGRNSSPSSSSLSSPNETCYSFVRRAIQKLAGGRRVGVHRPWFLESWSTCAKEPSQQRYDHDGCECCDCNENIQDIPIELRRVDEEDLPQRRQTFPSSQLMNDISSNLKSKSMTNIKTAENNNIVRSQSSTPSVPEINVLPEIKPKATLAKPKLVKQKKSICEEDDEEALDQPTDMNSTINNLPDFKVLHTRYHRGGVFKQRSLNEELMSTDRLKEKERVRQNIQKQASLNEDLIYQRHHTFDSFKDSFFSVSTSKRFQLIKTGFTNKIKNSTTIEKVTGTSLKNGFVRMFQNWKSSDLISPTIPENETIDPAKKSVAVEEKKDSATTERRHSKEDGSDSSKDSSLQSDTSVDSEDSFASVIFVPKSDPMSPTPLSPGPISPRLKNSPVPNSPRIKQSSCPTSPRIKQMPLTVYPLTKQLSSPKPTTADILPDKSDRDHSNTESTTTQPSSKSLAQKYSVPQIPKFRRTSLNSPSLNTNVSPEKSPVEKTETRNERLKKIKELLTQKPGFGARTSKSHYPIVRHSSVANGKVEAVAKPLPKLLSLELFNPETDDKDSDSSCVSSPDSIDSVINVRTDESKKYATSSRTRFKFPPTKKDGKSMSLLEAAADVANTLDEAVGKVIKSSPRNKRKLQTGDVLSIIQRRYSTDTTPLLAEDTGPSWDEECHRHLTDFADKLSEKLLQEIDQYQEKSKERALTLSTSMDNIDDPYIHRLSEELDDLSKLSAEIQKQNEYLAKLSASDSLFNRPCTKCREIECKCYERTKTKDTKQTDPKKVPVNDYFCVKNDVFKRSHTNDSLSETSDLASACKLSVSKTSIRMGTSIDSCDSDKGRFPTYNF
jgi:hypothetical protein